ncbi:heavy metal-responsive transcriptional regulator [Streptomyces rubellomurinus]|uniref:MerR family transcriptional regulator n=1 Tax=Streptomyces rubellomurinus (strain ATCC 31215) TaxID=359131 RepID=A0A0F2TNN4_STRR3|nr:heavy metal-responsive transcriptional regulator [Streptomyces rubellomurinus]KJS63342.1 MerR family transcriptional regulator [Streptomyces rubellomurinus]
MRIGVLAAGAGVSTKAVRFYEQVGLLSAPPRTSAGYRDYPPRAADRLAFVRDAQAAGLTLGEIREVLRVRDEGQAPCEHVAVLIAEHLRAVEERIAELTRTRAELLRLAETAAATDPGTCTEDDICRILASQ